MPAIFRTIADLEKRVREREEGMQAAADAAAAKKQLNQAPAPLVEPREGNEETPAASPVAVNVVAPAGVDDDSDDDGSVASDDTVATRVSEGAMAPSVAVKPEAMTQDRNMPPHASGATFSSGAIISSAAPSAAATDHIGGHAGDDGAGSALYVNTFKHGLQPGTGLARVANLEDINVNAVPERLKWQDERFIPTRGGYKVRQARDSMCCFSAHLLPCGNFLSCGAVEGGIATP